MAGGCLAQRGSMVDRPWTREWPGGQQSAPVVKYQHMVMCSASVSSLGRSEMSSGHPNACTCATRPAMSPDTICESLEGSVAGAPSHADIRSKQQVRAANICAMDLQSLSQLVRCTFQRSEPLRRGGLVMRPCNDAVGTSRCDRQSRCHPPTLDLARVRFSEVWRAVSRLQKRVK